MTRELEQYLENFSGEPKEIITLSPRQVYVIEAIQRFRDQNNNLCGPSIEEIGQLVGANEGNERDVSKSMINREIKYLIDQGIVIREEGVARSVALASDFDAESIRVSQNPKPLQNGKNTKPSVE